MTTTISLLPFHTCTPLVHWINGKSKMGRILWLPMSPSSCHLRRKRCSLKFAAKFTIRNLISTFLFQKKTPQNMHYFQPSCQHECSLFIAPVSQVRKQIQVICLIPALLKLISVLANPKPDPVALPSIISTDFKEVPGLAQWLPRAWHQALNHCTKSLEKLSAVRNESLVCCQHSIQWQNPAATVVKNAVSSALL